jgi:hypothetical protein
MEDIQDFYDCIIPRVDEALHHLNQYTIANLPGDARRLFYLTLSLAEIAPAVEFYKTPEVRNSVDRTRFVAIHGHEKPV